MRDYIKDEIWHAFLGLLAVAVAIWVAWFVLIGPTPPTGETIVYRTDRLPLPCEEVSK